MEQSHRHEGRLETSVFFGTMVEIITVIIAMFNWHENKSISLYIYYTYNYLDIRWYMGICMTYTDIHDTDIHRCCLQKLIWTGISHLSIHRWQYSDLHDTSTWPSPPAAVGLTHCMSIPTAVKVSYGSKPTSSQKYSKRIMSLTWWVQLTFPKSA